MELFERDSHKEHEGREEHKEDKRWTFPPIKVIL